MPLPYQCGIQLFTQLPLTHHILDTPHQLLTNPPDSSLPCILLYIYDLFLYKRYHTNFWIDPLLLLNPLCNFDKK